MKLQAYIKMIATLAVKTRFRYCTKIWITLKNYVNCERNKTFVEMVLLLAVSSFTHSNRNPFIKGNLLSLIFSGATLLMYSVI